MIYQTRFTITRGTGGRASKRFTFANPFEDDSAGMGTEKTECANLEGWWLIAEYNQRRTNLRRRFGRTRLAPSGDGLVLAG